MAQCVNTYCLHFSQNEEGLECEKCGCSLVVDERLLVKKLLGTENVLSSARTQTFEAIDLEEQREVILRIVHTNDPLYVTPLKNAVFALFHIHLDTPCPGIMQLVDDVYYFRWQIRSDEPAAHCMVSKKIDGVTLKEWLDRHRRISKSLATDWLKQLLSAVSSLHKLGFVHRDIKPENIMVTGDHRLVLIDFDAIYRLDASSQKSPSMGTMAYMAPEQANGEPRPASDLYSIGRTLVELLTGKLPSEVARKTGSNRIDWRRERLDLAKPFARLIDRLIAPNTVSRPVDADEALSYLSEIEATRTQREWRWLDSPVRTAIVVFGLTALSIGIGTISFSQARPGANRLLAENTQLITEAQSLLAEGNQLILSGQAREGLILIEQALELEPESAEIRGSLAIAQAFLEDYSTAIENYKIALELEPGNSILTYELANAYEEVDLQQAVFYYAEAIEMAETADIRLAAANNLTRVYLLTDQFQEADEVLASIDASTVEDPFIQATVLKNLAWLNYERGNFEAAKDYLSQSLEADPTQPDAYCISALIQQEQGEDNYADRLTCLNLRDLVTKLEVDRWRQILSIE